MSRLKSFIRICFVVLCCAFALPQSAFAADDVSIDLQTKIAMLELQKAQMNVDIAQANEQIAVLEKQERELKAAIAKMDAENIALANALAPEVTVVSVATFTRESPAEGWYAWKHQSRAYKKAHPWEKILVDNCARDLRICAKTAPAGTVFYLPAPEIRVVVPVGVAPPEAIMLAPTADPQVFTLALEHPVVTRSGFAVEKRVTELTLQVSDMIDQQIILGALAGIFLVLLVIAFLLYRQADRLRREGDEKIIAMGRRLHLLNVLAESRKELAQTSGPPAQGGE
jgi:hypothetical protein